ncbi:GDP-mannose 4,6-dehydratase [Demequina sp.]|uniref:GDP-mannose 4,6-dehydratase n=1 Tax=Demequina sp. TaxID=2050685 RepID=UPI003A8C879A
MRVLITGLTGQDGHYLLERLGAQDAEIHGLVRPGPGEESARAEAAQRATLHEADLGDLSRVEAVVKDIVPHLVFNLAGLSSVGQSWAAPARTGLVTGVGAVALLEATMAANADARFVQCSSAEIFGDAPESPQTEQTPLAPVSPYGAAKAFAHTVVQGYRARGAFASSCILYSHESPRRARTFVTRKITSTVAAIARGEADELVMGNVDARRDWGWAPDYVDAMVRAAAHHTANDYVIATGVAHSVQDFIDAAFDAAGVPAERRRVRTDTSELRPHDPSEQRGDATRARTELGWQPTMSFEDIVGAMVEHDLRG